MGRKGRTTVTWDRRVFPVFIFIALGLRPEKLVKKETGEIKEKEKLEKGNWHERENIGDRVKQDRHQKV